MWDPEVMKRTITSFLSFRKGSMLNPFSKLESTEKGLFSEEAYEILCLISVETSNSNIKEAIFCTNMAQSYLNLKIVNIKQLSDSG